MTDNKKYVFISGLHRSGTSVLNKMIASSEQVSGFENTGVWEDEGQHLQTVFNIAKKYGGPGKFAFDSDARLDESSELITTANQKKLFSEWNKYWNMERSVLVEKSPPNIIRTRFLQAMFPQSYFITILRHPIAVSYATQKWSRTSMNKLIDHWLIAHETYMEDRKFLKREMTFAYEEIVQKPEEVLRSIEAFLDIKLTYEGQLSNQNEKYFGMWGKRNLWDLFHNSDKLVEKYEPRVAKFGYSLKDFTLHPIDDFLTQPHY
jgi:hypothetical protein